MKLQKKLWCCFLTILSSISLFAQTDSCDYMPYAGRNNLGLYGGSSLDLTFCNNYFRLFAVTDQPFSLLYSDDTAKSWRHAFPDDSLFFECGERGWGGKGVRVLSNNFGWVLTLTLNSIAVSYSKGDSGTWVTLGDTYMMNAMGFSTANTPEAIAISDYYAYGSIGPYVVSSNKITSNPDVTNLSSFLPYNISRITSLAVTNTTSGYPWYLVVDTTNTMDQGALLFKYDGTNLLPVSLPQDISGALSVYTLPNGLTGDTLLLNGIHNISKEPKIFRSYDKGLTWIELSNSIGLASALQISDVDYSPLWEPMMPKSKGVILIADGAMISKDLGDTWIEIPAYSFNGFAVYPNDTTLMLKSMPRKTSVSLNGIKGVYSYAENEGFDAVEVKDIAKTSDDSIVYLATPSGLAYTTAVVINAIDPINKWKSPYGIFPIDSIDTSNTSLGTISVTINQNNPLHVIANMDKGFAVTTTGPTGFTAIPTTMTLDDPYIRKISFVNDSIVIAVTGSESNFDTGKGNIWRSADGGVNWNKVSPSGFSGGNCIAVGYANFDTIIYVGTGIATVDTGYIWKSEDNGITWNQVNSGPRGVSDTTVTGLPITDIEVDPRSNDTIYISASNYSQYSCAKSIDGGLTYSYINMGSQYTESKSVEINRDKPDTVYFAVDNTIYIYDALNDSLVMGFKGYYTERIPDISFGSLLCGTSTGFYNILLDPMVDIISNFPQYDNSENLSGLIYPSPAYSYLAIKLSSIEDMIPEDALTLSIFDLVGQNIFEQTYEVTDTGTDLVIKMPSEIYTSGLYFLNVRVAQKFNCTERIIIQR